MTPSPVHIPIDADEPDSTTAPSPSPPPPTRNADPVSPPDHPAPTITDVDMDLHDKPDLTPVDPQPPMQIDVPIIHDHPAQEDSDRPTKRARTNDIDIPSGPSTFSAAQHKFASSTVRTLRKNKDAIPFLLPVDTVALNIPHYTHIIKHPMDFSTIDRKLAASKPSKEDLSAPRYLSADEFVADVRLIFHNTVTFNGPDHVVTQMAKRLEDIFERQVKHMPPVEDIKPVVQPPTQPAPVKPEPAQQPLPAPPRKNTGPRRPSTSTPVIRRNDSLPTSALNGTTSAADSLVHSRPKREIHPPPPKDGLYADVTNTHTSSSKPMKLPGSSTTAGVSAGAGYKKPKRGERDDGTADQLKFCAKIITDLFKKQYYSFAYFFYDPVDAMQVPNYYKVIKKPIDLTTMRKKLDNKEYQNAAAFHNDFRLLVRNCENFNPPGTLVRDCGEQLRRVFDEKWAALPPLREFSSESEEDLSGDEDERLLQSMESQVSTLLKGIEALKEKKQRKEKKKKEDRAARRQQRAFSNSHASSSMSSGADAYDDHHKSASGSSSKPKAKPRTSSFSASSAAAGGSKMNGASSSQPAKKSAGSKPSTSSGVKKPRPTPRRAPTRPFNGAGDDDDDDDDDLDGVPNGPIGGSGGGGSGPGGATNGADDSETALDLSQKKELSETIEKLDETKLEKVIQIIQEGMPGIGNNSEEIELEIDALPPAVLQRLYNFVVKPLHKSRQRAQAAINKPPGARTGSGNTGRTGAAATGGVKRKSMDEVAEAEKIRLMEEKMKMFERGGAPSSAAPIAVTNGTGATNGTNGHGGGKDKNGPGMGAGHDEDESVSDSSDDDDSDSDSD